MKESISESEIAWRLPRGRGALPPPAVAEIQSERLCAALAALCAERGYAAASATAIAAAASVSSRTFYERFENKRDCLLTAQRLYSQQLSETLEAAWGAEHAWPDRVRAATHSALRFAAERPEVALLLIGGARGAGPEAAAARRRSLRRLAERLREGREHSPDGAALPEGFEEQLIAGLAECLYSRLLAGEVEGLERGFGGEVVGVVLGALTGHQPPISAQPADLPPPPRVPLAPSPPPERLSPRHIDDRQRARVFDSLLAMLAEHGYGGMTADRILLDAGMSARTFARFFDGKEDCVRAAYDHYAAQLAETLEAAWRAESAWSERVRAVIAAALRFAAERPQVARLLAVDILAAGPEARAAQERSLDLLATQLRLGRGHSPAAARLNPLTEDAIAAGFVTVVGNRLLAGGADRLPGLEADLTAFVLTPYLGSTQREVPEIS